MRFDTFAVTGLATVLTIVAAQPAWALDGRDFADKVSATFEANGMIVAFDNAEASGDTVTLSGISAAPAGEEPHMLDSEIVFTGVTENGDGSYAAVRAESRDIRIEDEDLSLTIGSIIMENLTISAAPAEDPLDMIMLYETFEMSAVAVNVDGANVVTVESITATNTPSGDRTEFTSTYAVNGIHAEPGNTDIEEISGMAAALGLSVIDAHMQGSGTWNVDTGLMEITESSVTIENAGMLDFTFSIGGYDLDLYTRMLELNREIGNDMSSEEEEERGMEVMQMMGERLTLISAAVRFDDDSITNKIIDLFAGMSGAPREAMVAGFAAAVPAKAAEMGLSEDMQAQLGNAAADFLADPQNLVIRVQPDEPTTFSSLAAEAEDPAALEDVLNIEVQANQ